MKTFSNICKSIGRFFSRKKAEVKQAIVEHQITPMMRSVTDPRNIIICGGIPMPLRLANQRQRRKLYRQIH